MIPELYFGWTWAIGGIGLFGFILGMIFTELTGQSRFVLLMIVGVLLILTTVVYVGNLQAEWNDKVIEEIKLTSCDDLKLSFNYYNSTFIEEKIQEHYVENCTGLPIIPWWEKQ